MPLRVLHIEDNRADALLVEETLREAGLDPRIERIERRDQLEPALKRGGIDLVLSDYRLPSFDGLSALAIVREMTPDLPFIMVTGSLGDEFAVRVMKHGASDFVVKENLHQLDEAVLRVLREAEERRARRAGERRQMLLLRELDHRVKNNLQAVIALCEQMLGDAHSLAEFGAAFTGRLHNMARLQEALAQSSWEGATVSDLIMLTVGPLARDGTDRLRISAPDRVVPASAASPLSMVLYELAVNAAKHGAFSTKAGRVAIEWAEHDGMVTLTWAEEAGRPVQVPSKAGRGTTLIEGFVRHELGGTAEFDFRPQGLVFVARFGVPKGGKRVEDINAPSAELC